MNAEKRSTSGKGASDKATSVPYSRKGTRTIMREKRKHDIWRWHDEREKNGNHATSPNALSLWPKLIFTGRDLLRLSVMNAETLHIRERGKRQDHFSAV